MKLSLPTTAKDIFELYKKGATLEAQKKIIELEEKLIQLAEENNKIKAENVILRRSQLEIENRSPPHLEANRDSHPNCLQITSKSGSFTAPQQHDETLQEQPPNYFDPNYLKRQIEARFGPGAGFLAIKYGSAAILERENLSSDEPNDEDYLILVYGNHYSLDHEREELGHKEKPTIKFAKALDIHIRLFDSFLLGMTMGRPYEISVATDGIIKYHKAMPKEYWGWIQTIKNRLTYDKSYLIENLHEDVEETKVSYIKCVEDEATFESVIAAYNLICDLIVINILEDNYPEEANWRLIYPLSKVKNLNKYVQNKYGDEVSSQFSELVDLFKRNKKPLLPDVFGQKIEGLEKTLRGGI
ncbi:MAG: hypothetical protein SVO01_08820 [Thermotogota bacterium]|nr:hypothetical protein [Thermotogota bacterium]